jgi:hypothetical protein
VAVRLDQPRQHAALADVDDLGIGSDERLDIGPAADRSYSTARNGQRLRGGL